MKHEINGNPDQGDLTVWLEPGESVLSEAGAMSRMSADLQVSAVCRQAHLERTRDTRRKITSNRRCAEQKCVRASLAC